jgi:hypothetical protein
MQSAAAPSESSSFLTMFCDRFRAHMSRLADDQDATFVRACTFRHSPFRSFVQNAIGPEENLTDGVVAKVAHSPDIAAIRRDVVGLVQCMANEQLIDLLSTAVPHFKQLWLSAGASSFEARQRLLREVDELSFETTLNLMAERSRFRLITLECYDRYETNVELRKNLWQRSKQGINYLLGKTDAKTATAATLQIKVLLTIFLGGSAAVGAGVHYHVMDRFRPAPRVVPVVAPAPSTGTAVPLTATVPSVAPVETVKISTADAHKQPAPAKTVQAQKPNAAPHAPKKDNHVASKDVQKGDAQKKNALSFLTKSSPAATTETEKQPATTAKTTDTQENTGTQTNTETKKKGGLFGLFRKKDKKDKTNNNQTTTANGKTSTTATH